MYDVIIVGAGPGGSFAAQLLAQAGYDVIVVEKETIPRDKPCAGWITLDVIKLLQLNPSKLATFQPMKGGVIWAKEDSDFIPYEVNYHKPISYGIRRIEFDTFLINKAKDAGAEIVDFTQVSRIHRQNDGILVQGIKNQEFRSRFIIGADGTHSLVAKEFGLRQKWLPAELTQCVVSETEVGEKAHNLTPYYGFAEIFLNLKATSYSWFFTKGNFLNIGLGCQMSKLSPTLNVKTLYNEHLQNLAQIDHLKDTQLAPFTAHTYPVYYGPYHYPTYGARAMLIGDAGGFPINYTGEGIRPALLTGKFAAETLIHALSQGQTNLKNYFVKWNRYLRDEYLMGDIIQLLTSPYYNNLYKSLLFEDKRFRGFFFDLLFNLLTPQQALEKFLLYSPFLFFRFLRFGFKNVRKNLESFNV